MMALQFFIQKVNFSSLQPPGRRVTGENFIFLKIPGRGIQEFSQKTRGKISVYHGFLAILKPVGLIPSPPITNRVNDVTKRFRRNTKRAFNGIQSFGFITDF